MPFIIYKLVALMVLVLDVVTPGVCSLLVNKDVYQEAVATWAAVTYGSEQCGTQLFDIPF